MLKKAMVYLGLGPDEAYEQPSGHEMSDEFGRLHPTNTTQQQTFRVVDQPGTITKLPSASAVAPGASKDYQFEPGTTVRALPPLDPAHPADSERHAGLSSDHYAKPYALSPTAFEDAQEIGDRFKMAQPIIINLQMVDRDLRRRLVDFASGLCYALGGKMDRVADQVYLLIPADVTVSREETRRALD